MAQHIGFIGVGMMGRGMAKNLRQKGHPVTAMAHRNRAPLEQLFSLGVEEAATPRAIAGAADLIIICVTGAPQVEAVVYGDDGILAGARDGQIVIDCSTSEPALTARLEQDLAAKGVRLADAPLARTPVEAEQGRLNTMVGAPDDLFAEIRPVLEKFCENIFHVGGTGAGHAVKLVYNFLAMGQAALIAEALTACAAQGVALAKFAEIVTAGGANSGIFQLVVPKALAGDLTGLQFSLANAEKDLRYYNHMTEAVPLTGTLGGAVHGALRQAIKVAPDGLVPNLITVQERLNNVSVVPGTA